MGKELDRRTQSELAHQFYRRARTQDFFLERQVREHVDVVGKIRKRSSTFADGSFAEFVEEALEHVSEEAAREQFGGADHE